MIIELKNSGFNVIETGTTLSYPFIEIYINTFFTEPEMGLFAFDIYSVIDGEVIIQIDKKNAYKRKIKGKGKLTTMQLLLYDNNCEVSFENAIDDFMKKSIPYVIELIESNN